LSFASLSDDVNMPEVKSFYLENGVRVFHIKDDLPRTVFYASIGYGRLYEDKNRAGVSELLARTLTIGGSKKYPGNKLYTVLESLGGEINFISGWENAVIELKVLSRHSDLAFDILSDILLNPLFDEKSLDSARELVLEKIRRSRDNPADLAFEKLREIIFCGSGYGGVPSEKTINSVTPSDLGEIWRKYFRGGNISIAASSSIKADIFFKSAEGSFSKINSGDRVYYSLDRDCAEKSLADSRDKIFLIPMDLDQATIVTGTFAPQLSYNGNYALHVMNYILGGGSFNSRLTSEIRVKRGLAYSVFSLVRNRYSTGVFMSFVQTRNENVPLVLSLINENINEIKKNPVPEKELSWAKESIINSFIFKFENISSLLSNYLDIDYNNLDKNYYNNYTDNIKSVTAEEILKEAKLLFGNGTITVIAGNKNIAEDLKSYGEVIILENAGN
jgi:predicted Zn-dependent peptidase